MRRVPHHLVAPVPDPPLDHFKWRFVMYQDIPSDNVDQSLARKLNADGIRTREDLLAKFDANSLSQYRRPVGQEGSYSGARVPKSRYDFCAELM